MTLSSDPSPEAANARPSTILHITDRHEYERQRAAGEHYVDPSLSSEGFIHCSTVEQVLIPANERFADREGLVLLVIDVAALASPVVYEDCYQSGDSYPHVYEPITFEAVTAIIDFPPRADGGFDLPQQLDLSKGDKRSPD